MNKKPNRFLLCENPLVNDGRVFILHSRHPLVLAEAFHFELDEEEEWMNCKRQFEVGASVDYPGELIALGAVWYEALTPSQETADELAHIMSSMGDWYYAYLKWEDDKIAKGEI